MDIEELSGLIEQHGNAIYGFCYRLTGNKADTDDLYQETFLKAMEMLHKMDAEHNPKGYLISIAVRLHRNSHRKKIWRHRIAPTATLDGAAEQAEPKQGMPTPENAVLSDELRGRILAAANQLNDKLRIPLLMHYTADLSVNEIASALRIPPGTVKSRLHKARKMMKKILEVESP